MKNRYATVILLLLGLFLLPSATADLWTDIEQLEPDAGDSFDYGESITFDYSVAANTDGEVQLRISNDYTNTVQTKCTHDHPDEPASYNYDCTVSDLEPGDHGWSVRFSDNDSPDADWTSYRDFTVEDPTPPDPELDSPSSGSTYDEGSTVDLEGTIYGGEEDGTATLFVDGSSVETQSFTSFTSTPIDYSESFSPGTYDWYVEADTEFHTETTSTRTFEVEEEEDDSGGGSDPDPDPDPPEVELDNPTDGSTFDEGTTIDLEGTVASDEEDGEATIYVDGSEIHTQDFTSFTSNQIETSESFSPGSYDWYIEADTSEHTVTSDTWTFTIEEDSDNGDNGDEEPDPPNIDIDNPLDGDTFTVEEGGTENILFDSTIEAFEEDGTAYLYLDSNQIHSDSFTSWSSNIFEHTEELDAGTYEFYVEADTNEHTVTSDTKQFTVEEDTDDGGTEDPDPPEITVHEPMDGESFYEGDEVLFDWTIQGEDEDGTATLHIDEQEEYTEDFTSSTSNEMEYTDTFTEGVYEFYVEADTSEHTVTSDTKEVVIEEELDPEITFDLLEPDSGEIIDASQTEVDLVFQIGTTDTSSDWELMLNGETVDTGTTGMDEADTVSTTVPVDLGETYEWYVEAEDDLGGTHTSSDRIFAVDSDADELEIRSVSADLDFEEENTVLTFELLGDNIHQYSGAGDVLEFTNETLQVEKPGLNVSGNYEVTSFNDETDSAIVDLQSADTGLEPSSEPVHTLEEQVLEREVTLNNNGDLPVEYQFTLSGEGDPATDTEFTDTVDPNSENSETGEWNIAQLEYESGQPSPVEQQVTLGEEFDTETSIEVNNTGGYSFESVQVEGIDINDSGVCELSNSSLSNVDAGSSITETVQFPCEAGEYYNDETITDELEDGREDVTIDFDFDIYSNITRQSEIALEFPISGVPGWEDRDSDTVEPQVNGSSHNITTQTTVQDVRFIIGDNHSTSSLPEGHHSGELNYETESTETDSGTPPPSGGTTIIENVTGDTYEWSVTAFGTLEEDQFEIVATPEREFERQLQIENTGDRDVELDVQCIPDSEVCDWVEISESQVELDTELNTEETITVTGEIPATATRDDVYEFGVFITDPSYDPSSDSSEGSSTVDFVISIDPIFGALIENIQKMLELRTIEPPVDGGEPIPYPFAVIPILFSVLMYAGLSGIERVVSKEEHPVLKFLVSMAVFLFVIPLL